MKMPPEYIKAQKNMKPGVITQEGFLGDDKRLLVDIIEADEEEFQALGLDFNLVADKLCYLEDMGNRALGEPATVDGKWLVQSDDVRGKFPCPFEDGIFHKNSILVKHLKSDKELYYSDLSIHLLKKHHFLQGRGSMFRLDPSVLKEILEM